MRRHSTDPILRRLGRQAGWLVGANVVVLGIAFVQNMLLARSLGPAAFGSLALILALTDAAQQLLSSRVWETATTYVTRFRAEVDVASASRIVKLCLIADGLAAVVACALIWGLAGPLARELVKDPEAVGALRTYAVVPLILVPVATGRALMRMADRYRWLSWSLVWESAVRVTAVFSVLLVDPSLQTVVVAYVVAAAFGSFLVGRQAARASKEMGLVRLRGLRITDLSNLRDVLRFMVHSNLSATFRLLSGKADVLILGWFAAPSSVGAYRLARSLADPLVAFSDPVYQAAYPEIARLVHGGDGAGAMRLIRRIRDLAWMVVVPVAVAVTLVAPWFIPWVFGASFAEAVPLTQILAWQLVWLPYLWVPGLLLTLGRSEIVGALTAVDAIVYVLMLLVFVPAGGATGAALATVLRFAVWTIAAAKLGTRAQHSLTRATA